MSDAPLRNRAAAADARPMSRAKKSGLVLVILFILLLAIFLWSFTVGRYAVPLPELLTVFFRKMFGLSATWSDTLETVLFNIRIPRIIVALIIGAALSVSGAAYQGLFRNPMVSPDILGASAGAGFGAAMALLYSAGSLTIQLVAFVFGIIAVTLTYLISRLIAKGNNSVLVLVLTGIVVTSLFSAFISLAKYTADPNNKLPEISFWLMGGLASITAKNVSLVLIPFVIGIIPMLLLRYKLNALSFGEEEAQSLGLDTKKIRFIYILCATLITASAVATGGMIGWVGLVIPHLARMLVGPNYKYMLPASVLLGGAYLLLIDDLSRTIFAVEIPLSILTAIIGAPFFIYLLFKGRDAWT
ncbi:MAG: putative ABC transporter permease protein [Pelotomaculum sp. PtaU1.Bin065]|nr:MAG: putative ABC transporter permease protein [Pelotomaculum sp. PtaU1.Bin065]